jgi:hypothetical protein
MVFEAITFDYIYRRITLRWVSGKLDCGEGKPMGLAQNVI